MNKHRWDQPKLNAATCIKCGVVRKKITVKNRMAITNHPPYDHYKYEYKWHYQTPGQDFTVENPGCGK